MAFKSHTTKNMGYQKGWGGAPPQITLGGGHMYIVPAPPPIYAYGGEEAVWGGGGLLFLNSKNIPT